MLAWLGAVAARFLTCRDEDELVAMIDGELRRGLGVDRVGLALTDDRQGTWAWVLNSDEQGRPFRDPARQHIPLDSFATAINLDRFADGRAVAYTSTSDLLAIATPAQRAHMDDPTRENVAAVLRSDDRIVGLLSVDNLPSGRPLAPALVEPLAVVAGLLARAVDALRAHRVERDARARAEALVDELTRSHAAWREREDLFAAVWEHTPDSFIILAADGSYRYISPSHARLLGRPIEEAPGAPPLQGGASFSHMHPDDAPSVRAHLGAILRAPGAVDTVSYRMRHADGSWRVLESIAINRVDDPAVQGIIVHSRDVTARVRAEESVRRSEEQYRRIVETTREGIWQIDAAGRTTYANRRMADLLGRTVEELRGASPLDFMDEDERARLVARLELRRQGESRQGESRYRRKDGADVWVLASSNPLFDEQGRYAGALSMMMDITERKRAEETLRRSEAHLRAVVTNAPIILFAVDRDGRCTLLESASLATIGVAPGQAIGASIWDVIRAVPEMHDDVRRALAGEDLTVRCVVRGLVFDTRYTPLRDAEGRPDGFICVVIDISERARAEEALAHQALHDPLTGLPNRRLLSDRLEQSLLSAQRTRASLALLLLDLDRFKEVNDTFGHHHGDALLREVGARLAGLLRATDTVARLGGDEFALLLIGADEVGAVRVAEQIRTALDAPILIDGQTLHAPGSVGVAIAPAHGTEAHALLRCADVAMYAAKRGKTGYAVYALTQDQHSPQRLTLVSDLRDAIARGALTLHYQPQVAISMASSQAGRGRLVGVEALVRWRHPRHGAIAPSEFIPLAEGTGLIKPLTTWVVGEALRQCRSWKRSGFLLPVSVNLSAWSLHDEGLARTIAALLETHGVAPAWLRLEITESALMADVDRAGEVLSELVALGVHVSVDDYGTGYSSLAYLKRLPVDELKIDRGFVRDLGYDETDAAIVRSTVALGHALGLRVVAEGVEDEDAWGMLAEMGCDTAQGYYVCRPLPAPKLRRWLRDTAWATIASSAS